MTYGSVTGIQDRIGDMSSSGDRTFTASSIPSLAEVERALTVITREIDVELEAAGYTLPVDTDTYTTPGNYLAQINDAGTSAFLLGTRGGSSFAGPAMNNDSSGPPTNRRQQYWYEYRAGIRAIRNGMLVLPRSRDNTHTLRIGSQYAQDGKLKQPIFERGMMDEPGARELSRSDGLDVHED